MKITVRQSQLENQLTAQLNLLGVELHFLVVCVFWLIVWASGINECDWCLAGVGEC